MITIVSDDSENFRRHSRGIYQPRTPALSRSRIGIRILFVCIRILCRIFIFFNIARDFRRALDQRRFLIRSAIISNHKNAVFLYAYFSVLSLFISNNLCR